MAQGPGTTTVITGANAGLGLATAVGVARTGANVILAVRSTTKGATAVAEIRKAVPRASVEVMSSTLPHWHPSGRSQTSSPAASTHSMCW